MTTTDLEYKYRVTVAGTTCLLPFTEAKKHTTYPALCIFHQDDAARAEKGSHLCAACTEWLRSSFDDIAQRWPDLEKALGASGGASNAERVSGTGDLFPPLPINTNISEVMGKARALVWSTVGQLIQDRPDQCLPRDHGTGVLAHWLARWHVGYLASHPSAAHLTAVGTDLAKVVPAVKSAAYQSPPVEVSLDIACHHNGCPGEVVATQTPAGRKVVRCSEDITHRVAADQWFYTHANSRPGRASSALKKKYLKARQ